MSEQTTTGGAFTEAPVSWNTRYISSQGFDCQLTLRGSDPAQVLKQAAELLAKMEAAGVKPAGNGHKCAAPVEAQGDAAQGEAAPMCPTHNKPMKASKSGGWFCPVKIAEDDGTGKPVYCKQRVK